MSNPAPREPGRTAPGDTTDPLLLAYVRRALEAAERGETLNLGRLCAEHPHLQAAVAEALGLAPGLAAAGAGIDVDRAIGQVLGGRYRLDARLGRGAMGAVFAARDLQLDRQVALKLFDTLGRSGATDVERFAREAKVLAALSHPHVVAIHDRGETAEGARYLVMPQLHGATLAALLAEQTASPTGTDHRAWLASLLGSPQISAESSWLRSAVRWCAQVARGLHAAHAQGILHRDVKPSNIFIDRDGHAILLDFGIAARDGDPALTVGESTLGTPWYMAPEQATRGAQTPALDVYGASATLYHLLTGQPPYAGDALQVLAAIPQREPPSAARLRPDLPRDVVAILEQGMQRRPHDRYRDAAALANDLEAFLAHRPVLARRIGVLGRSWRAARRAPARVAAAVAGATAVGLLAIALPLWTAHAAQRDDALATQILKTLPPLLAVEGQPSDRVLEPLGERTTLLGELDQLIAVRPGEPVHILWRALLRLDGGDHVGAAADLRRVSGTATSPYLAAVAERYAAADPQVAGAAAISLTDLPAPQSDFDKFVAALHELRGRTTGYDLRALALLDEIAERYLPARDLRLIALASAGESQKDIRKFELAVREANWLEGHYGTPTARVSALRGAALNGLGRFEAALLDLRAADQLRPNRHGPLHNLGVAMRRLGRLDEAASYFERAHALRPTYWNSPYMLALVHKERGDYATALRWCDALAKATPTADLAWRIDEARATVLLHRAMAIDTEPAMASADAEKARGLFAKAALLAPDAIARQISGREQLAAVLAAGDRARGLALLFKQFEQKAPDAHQLAALLAALPDGPLPTADHTRLRAVLWRVVASLTQSTPTFAARALQLAEQTLAPSK